VRRSEYGTVDKFQSEVGNVILTGAAQALLTGPYCSYLSDPFVTTYNSVA